MTSTTPRRYPAVSTSRGLSRLRLGAIVIAATTLITVSTGAGTAHAASFPVPPDVPAHFDFLASGTWTVPAGVHSITLDVFGGSGADGAGSLGGRASKISGNVSVTPGQQLTLQIGAGGDGSATVAGIGNGGAGGEPGSCGIRGARGGGASAIWLDGILLVVAAGGGGVGGWTEAGAGGRGGDADTNNAGAGEAIPGGLGVAGDTDGLAGADAMLCGGGGGGGGGGIHGGGGGGAIAGLSAGGGGGGVSYTAAALSAVAETHHASGRGGAAISFSLAMAASADVTVQQMRNSSAGDYPGVVTASGCGTDSLFTSQVDISAAFPIGDNLFGQVPISKSIDVPAVDGVLTVPLAAAADWIVEQDPARGTAMVVTVTCLSFGGPQSFLRGTFIIPAGNELGGQPPTTLPPDSATPPSTGPTPGAHPTVATATATATALANTGVTNPLPTVLLYGLLPLILGTLSLASIRSRRRTP